MTTVLITRPLEDSQKSQAVYQKHFPNIDFVIEPLITVTGVEFIPPKSSYNALIFTSRNAVRHFPHDRVTYTDVFCVGDATAELAEECGYQNVHSAGGDKHDLLNLISAYYQDAENVNILRLKKQNLEHDLLSKQLSDEHIHVDAGVVYKTQEVNQLSEKTQEITRTGKLSAILLYSPMTAKALESCFCQHNLHQFCGKVYVLGISQQTVYNMSDGMFENRVYVSEPNEETMIKKLKTLI